MLSKLSSILFSSIFLSSCLSPTISKTDCTQTRKIAFQGFGDSLVLNIPFWMVGNDTAVTFKWANKPSTVINRMEYDFGSFSTDEPTLYIMIKVYDLKNFQTQNDTPVENAREKVFNDEYKYSNIRWAVENKLDTFISVADTVVIKTPDYRYDGAEVYGIIKGQRVFYGELKYIGLHTSFWVKYRYLPQTCADTIGILRKLLAN